MGRREIGIKKYRVYDKITGETLFRGKTKYIENRIKTGRVKMNKSKELKEVISKYPEHELVFMYPQEGTEHAYTMGHLTQILVDEYWVNDDRVWLKYDNEDEIKEYYSEIIADEMFSKLPITDEENEVVENKVEELIKNIEWKKCICVYINC